MTQLWWILPIKVWTAKVQQQQSQIDLPVVEQSTCWLIFFFLRMTIVLILSTIGRVYAIKLSLIYHFFCSKSGMCQLFYIVLASVCVSLRCSFVCMRFPPFWFAYTCTPDLFSFDLWFYNKKINCIQYSDIEKICVFFS